MTWERMARVRDRRRRRTPQGPAVRAEEGVRRAVGDGEYATPSTAAKRPSGTSGGRTSEGRQIGLYVASGSTVTWVRDRV